MKETGVYYILNETTGKCYVGSSARSLEDRIKRHKLDLSKNRHSNPHLQNAWNKYGEKDFQFSVLEVTKPENSIRMEQFYITNIKPEFNILPNAGTSFGMKMPESAKIKISKANTGRFRSKQVRLNMSLAQIGRKASLETRKKMSISHSRENLTPEIRAKLKVNAIKFNLPRKMPVKQLNKITGEVIKIWNSISDAAQQFLEPNQNMCSLVGQISWVCKKKPHCISAKGFKWEYV